jgi:ABC-type lipoprotein export system ATPase subunit
VYRLGAATVPAVQDVTLSIGRGEFVALQGPSGSGKTTLLNLFGLLDRPDAGTVAVEGRGRRVSLGEPRSTCGGTGSGLSSRRST